MRKFRFNKHGVCLNPLVEIIRKDKKHLLKIELACVNKKQQWTFGYQYDKRGTGTGCGGSSASASKKKKNGNTVFYNYRHTARKAALKFLLNETKFYSLSKEIKDQLKMMIKKIPGEQLRLFD